MRVLLSNGANTEIVNHKGDTALIICAANGHTDAVKLLLSYNANPNHANVKGEYLSNTLILLKQKLHLIDICFKKVQGSQ